MITLIVIMISVCKNYRSDPAWLPVHEEELPAYVSLISFSNINFMFSCVIDAL